MRKFLALLFVFLFSQNVLADDLNVDAISAVAIDASTGRPLWSKDSSKPLAMASTTKIMTAIIALENCDIKSEVTVGKNPVLAPKVKMNLQVGEVITLENLLYALLMQSSNDAAVAIAEFCSPDVETFCQKMTQKAIDIGCRDTLFETPNGLDKGNHHSTAYDMALIGAYAIKNSEFIRISNTRHISFDTNKKHYDITNKNQLLDSYKGAVGIKTGFTGKAGHCFVGAVKRGDISIVTTVLASGWGQKGKSQKWIDTKNILNYCFDNYNIYSIKSSECSAEILNSKKKSIILIPDGYLEVLLKNDQSEHIGFVNNVDTDIKAPVYKGDVLGETKVFVEGYYVGSVKLLAAENAEENGFKINFDKIYTGWLNILC